MPPPKAEGVAMVHPKHLRSSSLSTSNIILDRSNKYTKSRDTSLQTKERVMGWRNEATENERKESEQRKTNKFSKTDYSSNIFFREGLKTRAEGSTG